MPSHYEIAGVTAERLPGLRHKVLRSVKIFSPIFADARPIKPHALSTTFAPFF